MKNNWRGDACNSINRLSGCPIVLEFFEFLELFWIFFGTGNVLEKTPFGIALQVKIFTINFLHYFQLPPVWIFYLKKILLQFYLNNRPSHQLTVGHNRRWMSFSKLPCVGCPLTHYSHSWLLSCILEWKQLWSKDCAICGHVILFRVCNQWSMYFMFQFYFLIFACF